MEKRFEVEKVAPCFLLPEGGFRVVEVDGADRKEVEPFYSEKVAYAYAARLNAGTVVQRMPT